MYMCNEDCQVRTPLSHVPLVPPSSPYLTPSITVYPIHSDQISVSTCWTEIHHNWKVALLTLLLAIVWLELKSRIRLHVSTNIYHIPPPPPHTTCGVHVILIYKKWRKPSPLPRPTSLLHIISMLSQKGEGGGIPITLVQWQIQDFRAHMGRAGRVILPPNLMIIIVDIRVWVRD